MNQGLIIGKKENALIAHGPAPQIQIQNSGGKTLYCNIMIFQINRPFPIAPMWPKDSTKS